MGLFSTKQYKVVCKSCENIFYYTKDQKDIYDLKGIFWKGKDPCACPKCGSKKTNITYDGKVKK